MASAPDDPTLVDPEPTRPSTVGSTSEWTEMVPIDPPPRPPGRLPRPARIVAQVMASQFPPTWLRPIETRRSLAYLLSGLVFSTVIFGTIISVLSVAVSLTASLVLAAVSLPFWWLLFVTSRWCAAAERWRARVFLGATIADPVPELTERGAMRRLRERASDPSRWREIAHHLLSLPVHAIAAWAAATGWIVSVSLLLVPLRRHGGGTVVAGPFRVHSNLGVAFAVLAGGIGVLLLAPLLTVGLARLELRLARALLGRVSDAELTARLARAERGRSAAIDSAEAERRRIERDLHDGAQQRLVALAAGLGAAREKLDEGSDPDGGRALVAEAHEEAKAALKEIRDLVRGIHPVILEDRGLDAALSAVVARAPVPVALDVRIPVRPPASIESAAYFVVNEALTNVARHARATRAQVAIARAGNRLVVEVRDDGVGGADASLGTGLQGLRERVSGLGGTLHVISPPGGPTTLSVELPCAS